LFPMKSCSVFMLFYTLLVEVENYLWTKSSNFSKDVKLCSKKQVMK